MRSIARISLIVTCLGLLPLIGAEEWTIPAEAAAKENPVPSTPESIAQGKALYMEHCLDCHGATGAGDGDGAALLGMELQSLTAPAVTKLSDGTLFYMTAVGRGDMPGYQKDGTIPEDENIWHLVNYMRHLAKPADGE